MKKLADVDDDVERAAFFGALGREVEIDLDQVTKEWLGRERVFENMYINRRLLDEGEKRGWDPKQKGRRRVVYDEKTGDWKCEWPLEYVDFDAAFGESRFEYFFHPWESESTRIRTRGVQLHLCLIYRYGEKGMH